ncbi:MAG TPA: ABC transporter permease [Polyangiaceae bacterium]
MGGPFDIDTWQEIWATLRQNRLRAFLTALGVFWGLFMLIVMLGLGKGLENGARKNLADLAPRAVYVWAQKTSLPYRGLQPGRYVRFDNDDIAFVKSIPGVEHVAARLRIGGWRDTARVVFQGRTGNVTVLGDMPAYAQIEPMSVERGRFLNDPDVREARKVVVLGRQARVVLFGEQDPIGEWIEVNGVHFRVVGEIKSQKGGEDGDRMDNSAFVPFSSFQRAFRQPNRVGWFALGVEAGYSAAQVESNVRAVLSDRHNVSPQDDQAIGSFDAAEQFNKVQSLFQGIRGFVWFVGTLTLLAGVLGVSNILLIIVKERTREIGVRKALGATPGSIVLLIVQEAITLTTLAGYAGLVAGVAVLEGVSRYLESLPTAPISKPEVDLNAALVAAGVLIVAGAIAGIVPARHAAGVPPVEALRSE